MSASTGYSFSAAEQKRLERKRKSKQLFTVTAISLIAEYIGSNTQTLLILSRLNSTFYDAVLNFCNNAWRNIVISKNSHSSSLPYEIVTSKTGKNKTLKYSPSISLQQVLCFAVKNGCIWLLKRLFQSVNYDTNLISGGNISFIERDHRARHQRRDIPKNLLYMAIEESKKYEFTVGGKHATQEMVDFLLARVGCDPWSENGLAVKACGDEYMEALIYEIERQEGAVLYDDDEQKESTSSMSMSKSRSWSRSKSRSFDGNDDNDENDRLSADRKNTKHRHQRYDSTEFEKIAQEEGTTLEPKNEIKNTDPTANEQQQQEQPKKQERPRSYVLFDIFEQFMTHFPNILSPDEPFDRLRDPRAYESLIQQFLAHFCTTGNFDIVKCILDKCDVILDAFPEKHKEEVLKANRKRDHFVPVINIDVYYRGLNSNPLFNAIYKGHEDVGALLVKRGASLKKLQCTSPLCVACRNGLIDLVKVILEEGRKRYSSSSQSSSGNNDDDRKSGGAKFVSEILECKGEGHMRPLFFAVRSCEDQPSSSKELVKMLCDAGADATSCDMDGVSVIAEACKLCNVDAEVLKILLDSVSSSSSKTALKRAVNTIIRRSTAAVVSFESSCLSLLLDFRSPFYDRADFDFSNHIKKLKLLIEAGADVNRRLVSNYKPRSTEHDLPPLGIALLGRARNLDLGIIDTLVDAGAVVDLGTVDLANDHIDDRVSEKIKEVYRMQQIKKMEQGGK